MTQRKRSPRIADKVLKEFNYLCAICGNPRPQVHHIDGNNSNNDELNLLPLCPNHHLLDAHSPTQPFEKLRLRLFREYKDPTILCSQFQPIFRRMEFLFYINEDSDNFYEIKGCVQDLMRFISFLEMGEYYKEALQQHIGWFGQSVSENVSKRTDYYLAEVAKEA